MNTQYQDFTEAHLSLEISQIEEHKIKLKEDIKSKSFLLTSDRYKELKNLDEKLDYLRELKRGPMKIKKNTTQFQKLKRCLLAL